MVAVSFLTLLGFEQISEESAVHVNASVVLSSHT